MKHYVTNKNKQLQMNFKFIHFVKKSLDIDLFETGIIQNFTKELWAKTITVGGLGDFEHYPTPKL